MNMDTHDIFEEALLIGGAELEGICARGQYAMRHLTPNGTMKRGVREAIKQAWDADPLPYARAAKMKPLWFDRSTDVSKFELLSAIEIGKVKDVTARALLAQQWQATTMSFDDVREAVRSMSKPKVKPKQPDLKQRLCEFIQELEHDYNNGAEMMVKSTKRAIADRLREMLDNGK